MMNQVATNLRPDSKQRICLTKALKALDIPNENLTFHLQITPEGQILLDPQISIPAREAWLWKNSSAFKSVQKGLAQSKSGDIHPFED